MNKKRIALLLMITIILGALSYPNSVEASSKNRSAGKAYAKAIKNGQINYNQNMSYNIADMNGDGIKDLLINETGSSATVYSYKNGRLITLLNYCPEYNLVYNSKKKVFILTGEGSGGWVISYKLKNGQLIEKYRYSAKLSANGISYEYSNSNKTKTISSKSYNSAWKQAKKYTHITTKSKLIKKLKKIK